MAQTIQKSSSGATFTVTDKNGIAQSYVVNDWGLYVYPNNNITLYNKYNPSYDYTGLIPQNGPIVNQPFGNIIDGDTSAPFPDFTTLQTYILTNFFRKAGGGGSGSLSASKFIYGEIPGGAIDGSNTTFTIANATQSTVQAYQNGFRLKLGTDYTVSGQTMTWTVAPLAINDFGVADFIQIDYIKA